MRKHSGMHIYLKKEEENKVDDPNTVFTRTRFGCIEVIAPHSSHHPVTRVCCFDL